MNERHMFSATHRLTLFVGLLFNAILTLSISACLAEASPWKEYMDAGDQEWTNANWSVAEKKYALALKEAQKSNQENLDLAKTLKSLAGTYLLENKIEEAKPLIDHAISIWETQLSNKNKSDKLPDAVVSLNNLGVLYLNKNKHQAAERMFDEAIKLDPTYMLAYSNRSITRKLLGNDKGADEDHDAAKRLGHP